MLPGGKCILRLRKLEMRSPVIAAMEIIAPAPAPMPVNGVAAVVNTSDAITPRIVFDRPKRG